LKDHQLGRTYVLFGQTISLQDYINKSESDLLNAKNINKAALSLTQKLKVEDHLASPVLLNMVVSTLLLYCNEEVYRLEKLVADCKSFYRYF
jgi:glycerol-3-phosphate O-acyltransferase